MYSRKAWGGSVDPFIQIRFSKPTLEDDADPVVSLVIFEFRDEVLIGRYVDGDQTKVRSSNALQESEIDGDLGQRDDLRSRKCGQEALQGRRDRLVHFEPERNREIHQSHRIQSHSPQGPSTYRLFREEDGLLLCCDVCVQRQGL